MVGQECIDIGPTPEQVRRLVDRRSRWPIPLRAIDDVLAGATIDRIFVLTTDENVIAAVAEDDVLAPATKNLVIVIAA